MTDVVVFAPSPVLTVTVEDHGDNGDIHLHAGGQGVWQARMLVTLGANVTMCSVFAGESGQVLRHLITDEGINVKGVDGSGYNGAYIHDRRSGERVVIADVASTKLNRHDLDELYGLTISTSLDAQVVVLSGPTDEEAVPADVYRRLAADLRSADRRVIADLSGDRLSAALAGGLTVVKVSDEELLADGRASGTSREELIDALHRLHAEGAANVIITRAEDPVLVLAHGAVRELRMPKMEVVDTRGAGDSLTAGVAATLARGEPIEEAVQVGVAAGALNVTRHGLGTGQAEALHNLRKLVRTHEIEPERVQHITPRDLAGWMNEE